MEGRHQNVPRVGCTLGSRTSGGFGLALFKLLSDFSRTSLVYTAGLTTTRDGFKDTLTRCIYLAFVKDRFTSQMAVTASAGPEQSSLQDLSPGARLR